jgi:hypothetical protein
MMTIFCDFPQLLAKIGVFLNTDDMVEFFQNLALFWVKTPISQKFFGKNIFKIITSVPGKVLVLKFRPKLIHKIGS